MFKKHSIKNYFRILENKECSTRKYNFIITICITPKEEMGSLQLTYKNGITALIFFSY